jgi:hypothetical protein
MAGERAALLMFTAYIWSKPYSQPPGHSDELSLFLYIFQVLIKVEGILS